MTLIAAATSKQFQEIVLDGRADGIEALKDVVGFDTVGVVGVVAIV